MSRTSREHADAPQLCRVAVVVEVDRTPEHEPAPRVGLVRVRRVERFVEAVRPERLRAQRPDRRRHPGPAERNAQPEQVQMGRRRVGLGPVPSPPVLTGEPTEIGQQVRPDREREQRTDGRQHRAARDRAGRTAHARGLERAAVPHDGEDDEQDEERQRRPLDRARETEHDAGEQPPRPWAQRRHALCQVGSVGDQVGQPAAHLITVEHEAGERGEDEELQEHVQDRRARQHQRKAVARDQQPGDRTEQIRSGHSPGDAGHHDHGERAEDRREHPPAEGVRKPVAEQAAAPADQPLTQRRMDDEQVAAVVLVAEAQQFLALDRVVRLVEDARVREAERPEPGEAADDREAGGHRPADPRARVAPRDERGRHGALRFGWRGRLFVGLR